LGDLRSSDGDDGRDRLKATAREEAGDFALVVAADDDDPPRKRRLE
jgi:hypothetical protein